MPQRPPPTGVARVRQDVARRWSTPGARRRALLYEELASLLQAGIGMRSAVASLVDRNGGKAAPLLRVWTAQVERGEPLHEGMSARPDVFHPIEATMFRLGEHSGTLVASLRKLAGRLEAAHAARRMLLAAVAYPVIVLHIALLLPTLPLVLLPLGFGAYVALVLAGLLVIWGVPALLAALYVARRDDPAFSRRVCRLPLVGAALHAGAVQRFAWTLGALQDAGETADVSLEEAALAADCGWFRSRLRGAIDSIHDGGTLHDAVRWIEAVPRDVCDMVATGELGGTVAESMDRAATLYQDREQSAVRKAAAAAGAVMFGLAVLVVVIAVFSVFVRVYGPVFEMMR